MSEIFVSQRKRYSDYKLKCTKTGQHSVPLVLACVLTIFSGSGIFLSPETVELMLSRLRDLGLPTIAETHWRENTVHGG